jgi:hypothetical protein
VALARNNLEGQPSGTAVTTANALGGTLFDVVTATVAQTLNFDNTHSRNDMALKTATGATAGRSAVGWTTSIGSQTLVWLRFYVYPTSVGGIAGGEFFARLGVAVGLNFGTSCLAVSYETTGKMQLRDSAGAAIAGTLSAAALPLNAWTRIEVQATLGTPAAIGSLVMQLYKDTNADGNVPDEILTNSATATTTGPALTYGFGIMDSDVNVGPRWLDNIAVSTDGWVGSAIPPAAPRTSYQWVPRRGVRTGAALRRYVRTPPPPPFIFTDAVTGALIFGGSVQEGWSWNFPSQSHARWLPTARGVRDLRALRRYVRVPPSLSSPIIFIDATSGAWIFAGSRTEQKRGTDVRTGAWIFAGSRTESRLGTDVRTGALIFGGSIQEGWSWNFPVQSHTRWLPTARGVRDARSLRRYARVPITLPVIFVDSPIGAWIFAGSRVEQKRGTDATTGAWIWGGSRSEQKRGTDSRSGAWVWGGTRSEARVGADSRSGALIFGGTRTESATFRQTAAGTWIWGGSRSEQKRYTDTRAGAWVWAGSRAESKRYTDTRAGAWVWAGSRTEARKGTDARTGTWIWVGAGSAIPTTGGIIPVHYLVTASRGRRRRVIR